MMNSAEIKAARAQLGLTQDALARKLCMTVDVIRKYESGACNMSPRVEKLLMQLMDGTDL